MPTKEHTFPTTELILERMPANVAALRFDKRAQDIIVGQNRLERTINIVVEAAIATHLLLMVTDIERGLLLRLRDFNTVDAFEELGMGPLTAHPLVRRAFQLPEVSVSRCASADWSTPSAPLSDI